MGFALSFLIGLGILRILSRRSSFQPIDFFLSWGMGVGIASQITFFAILLGNSHKDQMLFLLIGVVLLVLGIIHIKQIFRNSLANLSAHKTLSIHPNTMLGTIIIPCLALSIPLIVTHAFIYLNLPYGDWDAWGLWNYRANSLFRSSHDWMPIYHNAVQGKHPWLLPHYIVWGWILAGKETVSVPIITAFLMTLATAGLVVSGLLRSAGRFPAMLAGIYLVSIPYFTWHAAGQYASIFVAFFFLGSIIAIEEYFKTPSLKYAVVSGTLLAFLANAKDEGIVLAALILVFLSLRKPSTTAHALLYQRGFLLAFLSLITMLVLTEIFMRLPMVGIPFIDCNYNELDAQLISNPDRWKLLITYTWQEVLLHPLMGGVSFIFLCALIRNAKQKHNNPLLYAILCITIMFSLIFAILYVMAKTDLEWRLSVTANRLFFIFLPTLVYSAFSVLYKKETKKI